jgi:uncharacterized protein (TIGR03067 family)
MENMKTPSKKGANGPLEGTWHVVALEVDGQKMPGGMLATARIVVKGDRFESLGMGAVYEGDMKLDASVNPKAFDLTFTAGPETGNTALGIYELDGDDWKLCLTTRGGPRPKRFATEPGTGHAFETLKRGKAPVAHAEEVPAEEMLTGTGPVTELEGEWSMAGGFMDGHPIEKSLVKYGKRVTRGNQTTVKFGPQVFMQGTFTLDATKSPREIDFSHTQGMHKGKTQLGIYECDGKTFRLSSATPGQARPVDFEPRAGDGKTIAEWKFEKK